MSGLEGARCVGLFWLFDSTLLADHEEAKRRCAVCPVIEQCRQILSECNASQRGGGPSGTWAGELITYNRPPIEVPYVPIQRVAKCGTDGGYHRHRRTLKNDPCDPCKRAHAAAEQQRIGQKVAS